MRNRIFAVLAVAVLAGGGLAFATYNAMNSGNNVKVVTVKTQPVVVANADLSLGAEL
jgi:Flp pilus assembly protein CpaB